MENSEFKAAQEAARKKLEQLQGNASFTPNGFSASRTQNIKGVIIGTAPRNGYEVVFFIDEEGNEWTFLNKTPENNKITIETEIKFTTGKNNKDQFWILEAK